jgi:hypothetical protein
MKLLLSLSIGFLLSSSLHAKPFANKYCEFELPSGWECALEGSEYVCQSENTDRKKEAIIILAAKNRGDQDTLDDYMSYLKKSKNYYLPGGIKQISEPKSTKLSRINDQQWVDALHLASEVPGFYTRYLATVKEDIGVAVTFSVSKDLYATYLPIMDKLVSTLRVFRQRQKSAADMASSRSGNSAGDANFADATFNPNSVNDLQVNKTKKRGPENSSDNDMLLIVAIVIIAGVAMVIMKGRKKGGKKK